MTINSMHIRLSSAAKEAQHQTELMKPDTKNSGSHLVGHSQKKI